MVLERILDSPLDNKEIQPVNPKGHQGWILIQRTDAEAETPILWPPDVKKWFTGKDPDAGKDWRQQEKGVAEDEMVKCITDSMNMNLGKLQEIVEDRGAWRATAHGVAKSWTCGWTTTTALCYLLPKENARRPCGVSSELVINFHLVLSVNTNILIPVNPPWAGGHSQ